MNSQTPALRRKRRTKSEATTITTVEIQNAPTGGVLTIGGGLSFRATGRNEVTGKTYGRWTFRFTSRDSEFLARQMQEGTKTRQREMGLGPFPEVSLKDARAEAVRLFALVRTGVDPIEQDRRDKAAALAQALRTGMNFGEAVDRYLSVKLDEFRNAKHKAQWFSTLEAYALPLLGQMSVENIRVRDVQQVLMQDVFDRQGKLEGQFWLVRTETATRVRGRIENVLNWATATGHRTGDNPARWRGNLDAMLPKPGKVAKEGNHPAVTLADAARWFAAIRAAEGMGARAVEFLALTAARSGEVRGAAWDEIDLEAGLWIVPAARMKMEREHRVPLSPEAVALLGGLPKLPGNALVFPAVRGGQLSDMTLSAAMKRLHEADVSKGGAGFADRVSKRPAVPHGVRSTFRDWVAERTTYPGDMAETALAHRVGNAVETAYRRGDMVERRRDMMRAWADFLRGQDAKGAVVPFPHASATT